MNFMILVPRADKYPRNQSTDSGLICGDNIFVCAAGFRLEFVLCPKMVNQVPVKLLQANFVYLSAKCFWFKHCLQ